MPKKRGKKEQLNVGYIFQNSMSMSQKYFVVLSRTRYEANLA